MARINNVKLNEIIKDFDLISKNTRDKAKQMLEEGAAILVRATKQETPVDTRALQSAVKAGHLVINNQTSEIEVWPQGKRKDKRHKKPERNEIIGFVTQYGRKNLKPRPFMTDAFAKSTNSIMQKWSELWNDN